MMLVIIMVDDLANKDRAKIKDYSLFFVCTVKEFFCQYAICCVRIFVMKHMLPLEIKTLYLSSRIGDVFPAAST